MWLVFSPAGVLVYWSLVTSIITFWPTEGHTLKSTRSTALRGTDSREKVPHWWERQNEPGVFFCLAAGGGEPSCTLSTWSHCGVRRVEVRTCTLTHALLSFSCVCTSPTCRADLDLDCDSYHEDYYDRYCHPAPPHLLCCLSACQTGLQRIRRLRCLTRLRHLLNGDTWRLGRRSHPFFTSSFNGECEGAQLSRPHFPFTELDSVGAAQLGPTQNIDRHEDGGVIRFKYSIGS